MTRFTVYMPYGGYDEEVYSTALELVRNLMEEQRREEGGKGGRGQGDYRGMELKLETAGGWGGLVRAVRSALRFARVPAILVMLSEDPFSVWSTGWNFFWARLVLHLCLKPHLDMPFTQRPILIVVFVASRFSCSETVPSRAPFRSLWWHCFVESVASLSLLLLAQALEMVNKQEPAVK